MKRLRVIFIILGLLALVVLWFVYAPPRFWLNLTKPVDLSDPVLSGEVMVMQYECRECHLIGGKGWMDGPNLSGVTKRMDEAHLRTWLRNPEAFSESDAMPNFRLSDPEMEAIIAYLKSLDE